MDKKKQSHNCGLSGRASGCPLFIHPVSLSHVINPYTATPLRTIILPLFNIWHGSGTVGSDRERFSKRRGYVIFIVTRVCKFPAPCRRLERLEPIMGFSEVKLPEALSTCCLSWDGSFESRFSSGKFDECALDDWLIMGLLDAKKWRNILLRS